MQPKRSPINDAFEIELAILVIFLAPCDGNKIIPENRTMMLTQSLFALI